MSDQTGSNVAVEDVRWVVTVPAIWKQPAKQFMREAAYQVKIFFFVNALSVGLSTMGSYTTDTTNKCHVRIIYQ
jgi:hypothetical protein